MTVILTLLLSTAASSLLSAQPGQVTLTKDEALALKAILGKDQLLRELTASQSGLGALNTILSLTITGPVKLAVQWNQGVIKGWRQANQRLVPIGKQVICKDIQFQIIEQSPNQKFFENLYEARGCRE